MPVAVNRLFLAGKVLVAGGLIFLASIAFEQAQISYLRTNDPTSAYETKPDDALGIAGTLAQRLEEDPQFQPSAADMANLRNAVRNRPLEPNLLAFQGLHLEYQGLSSQAATAMQIANKISRRSVLAEMWLIENASASNDIKAALRHYHAVLSVHPEMHSILMPVLVSATAFPEVRTAIRPYLQTGMIWSSPFLDLASTKASAPDLVALLQPLPNGLATEVNRGPLSRLVKRLAVEVNPDAAALFASAMIPDFDRTSMSTFAVTPQTRDQRLGTLAWTFPEADGIAIEVSDSGELQATAQPLARGAIAIRELIIEENAEYTLQQRVTFGTEASKAQLRWSGTCIFADHETAFWEQRVPSSDESTTFQTKFSIPAGCRLVRFSVLLSGPDGQLPSSVTLASLRLTKSSNPKTGALLNQ